LSRGGVFSERCFLRRFFYSPLNRMPAFTAKFISGLNGGSTVFTVMMLFSHVMLTLLISLDSCPLFPGKSTPYLVLFFNRISAFSAKFIFWGEDCPACRAMPGIRVRFSFPGNFFLSLCSSEYENYKDAKNQNKKKRK